MTWEIVAGIITLATFIITVIKIVDNNNKTQAKSSEELSVAIAKLNVSVDRMNGTLEAVVDKVEQNSQDIAVLKERLHYEH